MSEPSKRTIRFTPEIRVQIREWAAKGITDFEIARDLGVTKRMLKYRCREELRDGYALARVNGIQLSGHKGEAGDSEAIEITPEQKFQIQQMAGYGLKNEQIAIVMGMGKMTLIAHCQEDIEIGRARAHNEVSRTLYEMATDKEHPNETKFYLKAQCGWKEATQVEFPDENGKPQKIVGDGTHVNIAAETLNAVVALLNEKV